MGATTITTLTALSDGKSPIKYIDGRRCRVVQIAGSASYATGGDSIALSSIGLTEVREAWVLADSTNASGASIHIVTTDPKNPLFKLFSGVSTEVASTTNVSTYTARVLLVGT